MKIFESKRFGALLTGTIAFATFFLMNMTSWKALVLAAIVMGLYFLYSAGLPMVINQPERPPLAAIRPKCTTTPSIDNGIRGDRPLPPEGKPSR